MAQEYPTTSKGVDALREVARGYREEATQYARRAINLLQASEAQTNNPTWAGVYAAQAQALALLAMFNESRSRD